MLHETQKHNRVNPPCDPMLIQKIRTASGARRSAKQLFRRLQKTPGADPNDFIGLHLLAGRVPEYPARPSHIDWLPEDAAGTKYGERSGQAIFTQVKEKSKINPTATVHEPRYGFAMHLLKKGAYPRYIHKLPVHERNKTTGIYIHNLSR